MKHKEMTKWRQPSRSIEVESKASNSKQRGVIPPCETGVKATQHSRCLVRELKHSLRWGWCGPSPTEVQILPFHFCLVGACFVVGDFL